MKTACKRIVILLLLFCCLSDSVAAQDIIELEKMTLPQEDQFYSVDLNINYKDNQEFVNRSDYPESYERKTEKGLDGNLHLLMFDLQAALNEYVYQYDIDQYQIDVSNNYTFFRGILDLSYAYLWVTQMTYQSEDTYTSFGTTDFSEIEKIDQQEQGAGIEWENWKAGYAPNVIQNWRYHVEIQDQEVIDEDVSFLNQFYEITRQPLDIKGPHFGLGYKLWNSKEVMNNRTGSSNGDEKRVLIGFGFAEGSLIFFDGRNSASKIEVDRIADGSLVSRNGQTSRLTFGINFSLTEESGFYFRRIFRDDTIDLKNTAYDRAEEHNRDEFKAGIKFSDQFNFEFSYGKHKWKYYYKDKTVFNDEYYLNQNDTIVGLSIKFHLSGS